MTWQPFDSAARPSAAATPAHTMRFARAAADISSTVELAGPQHDVDAGVYQPRTPQAYLALRMGRLLMYVHTAAAAEHLAAVWEETKLDALRLPQRVPVTPGRWAGTPDHAAITSPVVHVHGVPRTFQHLVPVARGAPERLLVKIDSVTFVVADQLAFGSCYRLFQAAGVEARAGLWQVDTRLYPTFSTTPTLDGRQAAQARTEFGGEPGFHWFTRQAAVQSPATSRPTLTPHSPTGPRTTPSAAADPPTAAAEQRRPWHTSGLRTPPPHYDSVLNSANPAADRAVAAAKNTTSNKKGLRR